MDLSSNMAPRVLDGRLALVTGAGQGNGRAIAIGLAKAGARVVVTDINAEPVRQTEAAIRAAGGEAWAHVLDVTSREACVALAEKVAADIGPVDPVVNNAGIIIREGIDSPRVMDNLRRTLDVNVVGSFHVVHEKFIKNKLRFETFLFRGIEFLWEKSNRFQISLKLCLGVD